MQYGIETICYNKEKMLWSYFNIPKRLFKVSPKDFDKDQGKKRLFIPIFHIFNLYILALFRSGICIYLTNTI